MTIRPFACLWLAQDRLLWVRQGSSVLDISDIRTYVDGMRGVSVLIFAKYPDAGCVNTRMVPPLTFEQAAELHRASLLAVCERVAAIEPSPIEVNLVVTPDSRVEDMRRLVGDQITDCWPQRDGDLGQRLIRATHRVLQGDRRLPRGTPLSSPLEGGKMGVDLSSRTDFTPAMESNGVLVLGADSPTVPLHILNSSIEHLTEHDAVMGPCTDGGYYLIVLKQPHDILFTQIDWGSERVAKQTRERAANAGVDLVDLPVWYDLDRFEDLTRAAKDLAAMSYPSQPATKALSELIGSYIKG